MRDLRGVLLHPAFGLGPEVRQARASGLEPDLSQRLGDILAVGLAPPPALAELPAAGQQSVGVLALVSRRFADLVEDADPFCPVGACVRPAPGAYVFACGHSGHRFHAFILSTVSCIWQTGCGLEQPVFVDSVRYYGKLRGLCVVITVSIHAPARARRVGGVPPKKPNEFQFARPRGRDGAYYITLFHRPATAHFREHPSKRALRILTALMP